LPSLKRNSSLPLSLAAAAAEAAAAAAAALPEVRGFGDKERNSRKMVTITADAAFFLGLGPFCSTNKAD
jgi:hypothetical protein